MQFECFSHSFYTKVDILLLNVIDLSQISFERHRINIQALYVIYHILVLVVQYEAK
jgi:hypothetical protein